MKILDLLKQLEMNITWLIIKREGSFYVSYHPDQMLEDKKWLY